LYHKRYFSKYFFFIKSPQKCVKFSDKYCKSGITMSKPAPAKKSYKTGREQKKAFKLAGAGKYY